MEMRLRCCRKRRPRKAVMSTSSNSTFPAVGSIRRLMQRSRVDFPAPELPMMETNWPRSTASEKPSRANDSPS